jgi:CHAT domain-containing protein
VPDGKIVVRYLVTDDSLLTWVLAGPRISFVPTPVDREQLRTSIGMMITQLGDHGRADAQRARLYRWLIAPIESQLGTTGDIVFVTSGELAAVPFAAVLERGGLPMFEAHPVSLALSVRAAADSSVTLTGPPGFLAPMYDPRVAPGVPPLPRATLEVDSAEAIFPGSRVIGAGITPRVLMDSLPRFGMFYFAGHAVLNVLNPERSYLALGQGRRDEQLTAAEIEGLPLNGMRLVVLSACSSLGGSGSPSGITGLSGAFLGAGAHGVVGSLWRVNDEVTLALMTSFHRHLREGLTPERALHQAQIEMLTREGDRFRSPAAWGAFQYVHK